MSDRLKEQALEAGYGNGIGSQLLARIDELEAINQSLTASCDNTWHCACIVPLQKRIAELEREQQATENYASRLKARVRELEAEVVSLKAAGRDYVELTLKQIKELEAELASASEAFAEKDIERYNRIKELEAELAKCRWHRAHEEADEEIAKQMKRALRAELTVKALEAEIAKAKSDKYQVRRGSEFIRRSEIP